VTEAAELRGENARLAAEVKRVTEDAGSSGPTAREAAQSERFRLHLQRLQRDLEAVKKERDHIKMQATQFDREEVGLSSLCLPSHPLFPRISNHRLLIKRYRTTLFREIERGRETIPRVEGGTRLSSWPP